MNITLKTGIALLLLLISMHLFEINYKMGLLIVLISWSFYIFLKIRHDFALLPLYLITKIQGKNFKSLTNLKEIKKILKLTDKGHIIEELFASPAWDPILSVESTNGTTWETLKKNLMKFIEFIPSKEKLREISEIEKNYLLKNKIILDSKLISKYTLKIFLKWLFCENYLDMEQEKENQSENQKSINNGIENIDSEKTSDSEGTFKHKINSKISENGKFIDEFSFINKFLTEEFLDEMYKSSLEYRKEIAIKGKGDQALKKFAVDSIVKILKASKYANLLQWEKPECYSILMQPFIISPMINMSDIAVLLEKNSHKYSKNNFDSFFCYLDYCLYSDHPFPILERYEKESNTQYFIDLRTLQNFVDEKEGNILNFGLGIRGCLGRFYAKEFIKGFFEDFITEKDLFKPKEGHLYSGRDNDNADFSESLYQVKILYRVFKDELIRNFKLNYC